MSSGRNGSTPHTVDGVVAYLAELRKADSLTPARLSVKAGYGPDQWRLVEKRQRNLTPAVLVKVAGALGLGDDEVSELLVVVARARADEPVREGGLQELHDLVEDLARQHAELSARVVELGAEVARLSRRGRRGGGEPH